MEVEQRAMQVLTTAVYIYFEQEEYSWIEQYIDKDTTWTITEGDKSMDYKYPCLKKWMEKRKWKDTEVSDIQFESTALSLREVSVNGHIDIYDKNNILQKWRVRITSILKFDGDCKLVHLHVFYPTEELEYVTLYPDIKEAIQNQELKLYVQPLFDINSCKIISGEVLTRWQKDNIDIHMPNEFIPILEKKGDIEELDYYVLETLCKSMMEWKREGKNIIPISINQSMYHFMKSTYYVEKICDILDRYKIEHKFVVFEITETLFVDLERDVKGAIKNLKEKNFSISMDDFGTGANSFKMISVIYPDELKIDKSLVDELLHSINAQRIVRNIIYHAHSLHMRVVCEGIENEDQLKLLRNWGCDIGQGYLVAKPMPIDEFAHRYLS